MDVLQLAIYRSKLSPKRVEASVFETPVFPLLAPVAVSVVEAKMEESVVQEPTPVVEMAPAEEIPADPPAPIWIGWRKITEIQKAVAAFYGLTIEALLAHGRAKYLIEPRHVAIWLCCRRTRYHLTDLGRRFRRDHTSIIHARNRIKDRMVRDAGLNLRIMALEVILNEKQ